MSTIAFDVAGKTADTYNNLGTAGKIGTAALATLVNPIYWIVAIVVILVLSVILWLVQPSWMVSFKYNIMGDGENVETTGTTSYLWILAITTLITLPLLFIMWTALMYGIQSVGFPILGAIVGSQKTSSL